MMVTRLRGRDNAKGTRAVAVVADTRGDSALVDNTDPFVPHCDPSSPLSHSLASEHP